MDINYEHSLKKACDDIIRSFYRNSTLYLSTFLSELFLQALESGNLSNQCEFMKYIYLKYSFYWEQALDIMNVYRTKRNIMKLGPYINHNEQKESFCLKIDKSKIKDLFTSYENLNTNIKPKIALESAISSFYESIVSSLNSIFCFVSVITM